MKLAVASVFSFLALKTFFQSTSVAMSASRSLPFLWRDAWRSSSRSRIAARVPRKWKRPLCNSQPPWTRARCGIRERWWSYGRSRSTWPVLPFFPPWCPLDCKRHQQQRDFEWAFTSKQICTHIMNFTCNFPRMTRAFAKEAIPRARGGPDDEAECVMPFCRPRKCRLLVRAARSSKKSWNASKQTYLMLVYTFRARGRESVQKKIEPQSIF